MSNQTDANPISTVQVEPSLLNQADPVATLKVEMETKLVLNSGQCQIGGDEVNSTGDGDSGTSFIEGENSGTQLQRCEWHRGGSGLPDIFQTSHFLFYERFKAYQDYMLGDCKPSEVRAFISDYLEKVVVPCDWLALWSTDMFDVLVEVRDVDLRNMRACVKLVEPMTCDIRGCELTEDTLSALLEATQQKVALQELHVVYEESGKLDQTAIALEHLRFFYNHIWRQWDDEDDDDFDYFVRCVEPRLRLRYDILEGRVPVGLVEEYQSLLERCSQCFQQFVVLRNTLSDYSDSELGNVSMVEGLKMCDQLETFKRKLHIMENPLLRYVLACKGNVRQQFKRGPRASSKKVVHVVTASCTSIQLQSLLSAKLTPLCSAEDTEIQFHREPVSAVDSCHQGDVVVVLPGIYKIHNSIFIPDSITIEGFGFPDEVVIEKRNKGDSFVESAGADVKISNIKFIQNDAIGGILSVCQGTLNIENAVLQCETTGVIVQTSARLIMNMCDVYGSKGAGVEIYPGSVCSLVSNGIHHCKNGILIKDFADEIEIMPSMTLENNVIHNNADYGVCLVKPKSADPAQLTTEEKQNGEVLDCDLASTSSSQRIPQHRGTLAAVQVQTEPPKGRKWQSGHQLSRNKMMFIQTTLDLKDHQMFVSMQGNQFKRNGKGDFGTFFY